MLTMRSQVIGLSISILLGGCYDWRAGVTRAASLDHECPMSEIRIANDDGNGSARAVVLIVCGNRRVYRDINASVNHVWVDSTGAEVDAVTEEGARPDGRAVVGASTTSASREAEVAVRAHLVGRAGAILACSDGGPVTIEAGWDSSLPVVRFTPRDISEPTVVSCILAAAGELTRPPGPGGHLVHALAPSGTGP